MTITVSLVLVGGLGYFILESYMNNDSGSSLAKISAEEGTSAALLNEDYAPTEEDCRTVLFVYEEDKQQTDTCIVLSRFIPTENKAVIVPLQSDICTTVGGKQNTLYEFYRLGGITELKKAVEAASGISIDKYMKFNTESFTLFSNYMGNITYDVPYNLIYENEQTGESIIIKEGQQILDAVNLRNMLTFPNYKGGEEYRAKVVGQITVDLVNSGSQGILQNSLDSVFNSIINSDIDTDITKYDYEDSRNAISYVLKNTSTPAQVVLPSGAYNENNCYELDDNFVKALPRWFGME